MKKRKKAQLQKTTQRELIEESIIKLVASGSRTFCTSIKKNPKCMTLKQSTAFMFIVLQQEH